MLRWSSGKGADSPPRWRWNRQICFILHQQLTRSCKSATKGPRGQHTNPSIDFQQKRPWAFQLCFTKCKKWQQVTALLFSRLRRTTPSRSWHADMSKAANALNESGIAKGPFSSVPPPWKKSQQFFHHRFQKMNHPVHKSPPNAGVSVLAVLPRKTQVRYRSGKRHANPLPCCRPNTNPWKGPASGARRVLPSHMSALLQPSESLPQALLALLAVRHALLGVPWSPRSCWENGARL